MPKILIPMKNCISVSPNLTGSPNITGVRYSAIQNKVETVAIENFELNQFLITRDRDGNITSVANNPEFDYEVRETTIAGNRYKYVELKLYIENTYLQYIDIYDTLLQSEYIKYYSGTPYYVAADSVKATYTWSSGVVPASMSFTHLTDSNGLYILLRPAIRNMYDTEMGHNQTFQISIPQLVQQSNISTLVGTESADKVFDLTVNDYMDNDTTIGGVAIAQYNANKILANYSKTKQTIEATLIMADYYNDSNELTINKSKGETFKVGDKILFNNFNSKEMFTNKTFAITSCEFDYNGAPKMLIKAKEVLDLDTREFKVNMVNPEYMNVTYSYTDYLNATLTGAITKTTIFDDIKSNANILISALAIQPSSEYFYKIDTGGGIYGPATSEITITGSRQPHIKTSNSYDRDVAGTLVTSDLFANYTGNIIVQGRIYGTLNNGGYVNAVGTSSASSTVALTYSSYYNGWIITLSDEPIDEEDDYIAGHARILINSTGIYITWDTLNVYNVYTITKLYIIADSIRKA